LEERFTTNPTARRRFLGILGPGLSSGKIEKKVTLVRLIPAGCATAKEKDSIELHDVLGFSFPEMVLWQRPGPQHSGVLLTFCDEKIKKSVVISNHDLFFDPPLCFKLLRLSLERDSLERERESPKTIFLFDRPKRIDV